MITTKDCKEAIIEFVSSNKAYCESLFSMSFLSAPMYEIKNWKRMCKESKKEAGKKITVRTFDCKPYDDQIRAYVTDDGINITKVEVFDE